MTLPVDAAVDQLEAVLDMVVAARVEDRASAYFQGIARRVRVLSFDDLDDLLEPMLDAGRVTGDECESVRRADVIARGRRQSDEAEILLAVEVSWGIGTSDVERAVSSARILGSAGVPAVPVVPGSWISPEANARAVAEGVTVVVDGGDLSPAA